MKGTFGDDQKDRLIEDVIPPESPYFDVRSAHVQHQAIGALDEAYRGLPHPRAGWTAEEAQDQRWLDYLRVPPIKTLSIADTNQPNPVHVDSLWQRLHASISAALAASLIWISQTRLKYLPRRIYTLDGGRHIYWGEHRVANRLKLAIGIAIIAILVVVGLVISSLTGHKIANQKIASGRQARRQPTNAVMSQSSHLSSSNQPPQVSNSGGNSSPDVSSSTANPASSSSGESSLVGGRGGGQAVPSSSSQPSSSSGGSLSVTLPGQTVTSPVGGKTILQTGPVTVDPAVP